MQCHVQNHFPNFCQTSEITWKVFSNVFNSKYSNKNGQNLFSFLIGILGMNYKYRLVRINMNDMLLYNISIPNFQNVD